MAKFKVEFDGFNEVISRLKKFDGDVKATTEKALKASRDYSNVELHKAMRPHKRTGKTEKAIVENEPVKWTGNVANIEVGFDLKNGGLPSIFLMHGTLVHGTPRIKKDQKLYNAIHGKSTKKKIKELQSDIFYDAIRKLGG